MNDMMPMHDANQAMTAMDVLLQEVKQMEETMQAMARLMRTTNEAMVQLQRQVRLLEKVTPAQASAINQAIRERAGELCAIYLLRGDGCEKPVAAAIRKAVRLRFGVNGAKELPRCEYEVAMAQVQGWDDYKTMKEIKERNAHVAQTPKLMEARA